MEKVFTKISLAFLVRAALLLTLMLGVGSSAYAQTSVVVHVKLNASSKQEPVPFPGVEAVNITHKDGQKYVSDNNGDIKGQFFGDETLKLTHYMCKEVLVKLKNRKEITVVLEYNDLFKGKDLDEAVKTEKLDAGVIKPTVAKAEGNWIPISMNGLSPKGAYMDVDNRWVVQAVAKRLIGNAESGWKDFENQPGKVQMTYLSPLVVDRTEYDITQNRLLDFDMSQDLLSGGTRIVAEDSLQQSKWIEVRDSSNVVIEKKKREHRLWNIDGGYSYYYAEDLKDNYVFYILTAYEDYHHVLRVDTAIRAVGVSRPWRWLEYNFASQTITDPKHLPKEPNDEPQKQDGEMKIFFENGKSNLNLTDSLNQIELAKMKKTIDIILSQKNSRLMGVTFIGGASPEGGYQTNVRLANERLASLRNYFKGQIGAKGEGVRWGMSDKAEVATWEQVADAMAEDGLTEEVDQIRNICAQTSSIDGQYQRIRNLGCYEMIKEKYLPRFRTTRYQLQYVIYGKKSMDDVRKEYNENGISVLPEYYAWQLYKNEPDTVKQMEMLKELVELYPNNYFFANDMQCMLIQNNNPDCELLKKYVQRRRWITNQVTKEGVLMPEQVFNNHVISLLHHSKFSAADSVLQGRAMPQTENNKRLRIFVKVLAGDKQARDDNFEMIAKTSPRNRVIMLLMRDGENDNKEALQLCQDSLNSNDPVALYLTAVCHSRLEDTEKAEEILYKAIRIRPDLENAARYDGDLSQLPMFKEDWETLFMTREEIEERERKEMARFMKEIENIDLSLTFEGYKAKVKADKEAEEARIKAEKEAAEKAAEELRLKEEAKAAKAAEKAAKKAAKRAKKNKNKDVLPADSITHAIDSTALAVPADSLLSVAGKTVLSAKDSLVPVVDTLADKSDAVSKKAKKSKATKKSKKKKSKVEDGETQPLSSETPINKEETEATPKKADEAESTGDTSVSENKTDDEDAKTADETNDTQKNGEDAK